MGLAWLFSTPNSSPFLSAQNAFVILLSVLIQMGEKGQEREEKNTKKNEKEKRKKRLFSDNLVREFAESGKPAVGTYSSLLLAFACCLQRVYVLWL